MRRVGLGKMWKLEWIVLSLIPLLSFSAADDPVPTPSNIGEKVEGESSNSTGLFQVYKGSFRNWVKKPLVHGLILPGVIGTLAALLTVCSLCCLHTCVKNAARRRRKQRIANLAEELKSDKAALLNDSSDEELG